MPGKNIEQKKKKKILKIYFCEKKWVSSIENKSKIEKKITWHEYIKTWVNSLITRIIIIMIRYARMNQIIKSDEFPPENLSTSLKVLLKKVWEQALIILVVGPVRKLGCMHGRRVTSRLLKSESEFKIRNAFTRAVAVINFNM